MNFWEDEKCEYCQGTIIEKNVITSRRSKGKYFFIENVPAGVCGECGTRYYSASVLKRIEEIIHGKCKAKRKISVPLYSMQRTTAKRTL